MADKRHPCAPPYRVSRSLGVEVIEREHKDDWADEIKCQEEDAQAAQEASYEEGS